MQWMGGNKREIIDILTTNGPMSQPAICRAMRERGHVGAVGVFVRQLYGDGLLSRQGAKREFLYSVVPDTKLPPTLDEKKASGTQNSSNWLNTENEIEIEATRRCYELHECAYLLAYGIVKQAKAEVDQPDAKAFLADWHDYFAARRHVPHRKILNFEGF